MSEIWHSVREKYKNLWGLWVRAHAIIKNEGSLGDSDAEKGGLLSLTYASPPEWDCPPPGVRGIRIDLDQRFHVASPTVLLVAKFNVNKPCSICIVDAFTGPVTGLLTKLQSCIQYGCRVLTCPLTCTWPISYFTPDFTV